MPGRRPPTVIAVIAVAAIALAGCGSGNTGTAATSDPARLQDCPPTALGEALPTDAVPTAVISCDTENALVPGDGEWRFLVRRRATEGLEELLTALRLPSAQPTNEGCTADLRLPTTVLIELGDRLMPVQPPLDECGRTRPEVLDAYHQGLRWTEVSRTRVRQLRSETAVAAGCDQRKDMLALGATTTRSGSMAAPSGPVHVCRYRSTYPPGWTPESRADLQTEPVGGFGATAAQSAEIVAAVGAAPPAGDCTLRHSGFALVTTGPAGQGSYAYVELDGCLRILAPDGTMRQGDRGLVTLLATG